MSLVTKPQTFKLFTCDFNESNVLYQPFVNKLSISEFSGLAGGLPSSTLLLLFLFYLFCARGLVHDLFPEIFHVQENLLLALILTPWSDFLPLVIFASFPSCSECYCEKVSGQSDFHCLEVTGCYFPQSQRGLSFS